jgi:hypothetical protein
MKLALLVEGVARLEILRSREPQRGPSRLEGGFGPGAAELQDL